MREGAVVGGVGGEGEIDVEEDPLGAGSGEPVDELRLGAPRPRPIARLLQRAVVDQQDDDVATGVVLVKAVAGDAKPVLGDLTETDKAEDEAEDRRPQKQLPWRWFGYSLRALRHVRSFPSRLPLTHARGKVMKSLTAS